MKRKRIYFLFLLLILSVSFTETAWAQHVGPEPKVLPINKPKTPLGYGLRNGLGFNFLLDNFGFGIGAQYRRVISPMSELTLDFHITALRNVSEQTFQTFFGQVIPNKYNRILAFPLLVGFKHRIFARPISDNFRVFLSGSVGPSLAFIYPYFKDYNGNHIRNIGNFAPYEPVNDIFTDWKDGHFQWGGAGKIGIGIDFGSKMKALTSVEFGYYFQYFPQGIQVLEPKRYEYNSNGSPVLVNGQPVIVNGSPKQKYFGSPVISLVFGRMW